MSTATHQVVIVGGGFGGLHAARSLRRANVEVTLVDRRNFHLFQPLLYQVATGGLSPANIAAPLRFILRRQKNVRVLMAEVVDINVAGRQITLDSGEIPYDTLVLAAGSQFNYFGNEQWASAAPGLKTLEDATMIRRRVLLAFERAEREPDPARQSELLTFVVIGGGPTGVEMAGALAELSRQTLKNDFRSIDPSRARILLLEAAARILPPFSQRLGTDALGSLEQLGVEVLTSTKVTDVRPTQVTIKQGDRQSVIQCGTVLWTAGVKAARLADVIAGASGAKADRAGRLFVEPDLTLPGHPEIFIVGDMAHAVDESGKPLPGLAPVAMQQGRYAGQTIQRRLAEQTALPPFKYRDRGSMATIGRAAAVANLKGYEFSGVIAWLLWLFVHLMYLMQFQNRVLVLIQWGWNYLTRSRSARLITVEGEPVERHSLPAPEVAAHEGPVRATMSNWK